MAQQILSRAESDARFQWDLSHIFATEADWAAALERCRGFAPRLAALRGRLGESGATLLAYYKLNDELDVLLGQVYCWAAMRLDEDSAVAASQERMALAQKTAVELSAAGAFARPELMAIPDERLEQFYRETPELETYRIALDETRRLRAHVLSEAEEKLLAAAGELTSAPHNIFGLMESADLRFPDVEDAEGKAHAVTNGGFTTLLQSPDRLLRERAFHAFYGVWQGMRNTSSALMNAQHKAIQFKSDARKYPTALEASLDSHHVPTEVYDNLLRAVNENLPKLHRYMALRKRLMGLDELHMYDIYTSLVPAAEMKIPYAEAQQLVKEALSVLGEDYVSVLQRAFDERWIDVYENRGKRSGAYSCGVPGLHPYVLLNHKDTLQSAFTLAHELGHSMHSYLSAATQPTVYSDYVIFVAEVASTVNEALLMQYLLRRTTDKTERTYLVNYFLEQIRTTIYRQAMFAEFEKWCGDVVGKGGSLTADSMCAAYHELNRRYYGEATTVDEEISIEWARIPHFYLNYYVFQYATGFSAALAISRRILTEGESAVRDYKRFLSSGCSMPPIELLKIAGADMTTAEPVNAALEQFGEMIDELEALTK